MSEQPEVERKPPLTDAELEALVHEHAKQRARRMAQAISDLDQSLNQDALQEAQAKPIRRANGGAGNTEAPSNAVKPKPEHADAQTLLAAFMVELAEGEEFVVVNVQEKRESFWKRNGRLENSEGKQSRGSIVKILTKGGKLVKKDSSVTPDVATPTDEPKSTDTTLDLNSDAAIAQRIEKQNQKQRVNSLFDKLVEINTDESMALGEEAIKLLADLTIQADEAKVRAFEEKAQAILKIAVLPADQPLGTVDPVIRNLDGKGKEQKELFELREGDTFERTVDGKTEGIRITRLDGDRVEVHLKTNFKDGSKSDETFGTTIGKFQKELREKGFTRGSTINFSESTRVDINLDALSAPDTPFNEALAFQPLGPGEQATYKGDRGLVTIERDSLSGLYWITDEGVDNQGPAIYTEEDVRNNAELEKWQRVETSPKEPNPELRGRDPRNYDELFEDDVWVLYDTSGKMSKKWIIGEIYKKKGTTYAGVEEMNGNDKTEPIVEIEVLRRTLQEQGFVLQQSGETSERALDGSAPKPAVEAKDSDKMTEVERLKLLLDGDRLEFVTVDYKQNTAWSKVTGKIRALLGGERNDADTRIAREKYENALIALQNAQIEDIKTQGLTGDELRIRMGEMLMYYKYDERVKLFETRTRVAAEQKGWPQKAWDTYEKIGTKYNALPSKVRIGIAVGGLALAGGLAFAGAAGAAAGTLALRRALASFAAGASLNTLADKGAEGVRKYRVGKEHDREMTRLGALENQPPEVTLELLEKFLAKDRENLDTKFQRQKLEQILRRTFILGGSGLASTYFSFKGISDFLSGGVRSAADQAQDLERVMRERGIKPPGAGASAAETGRLTRSMAPATSASGAERASMASSPASASSAPTAALTPERPVSAPGATTPIASPRVVEFAPGKPVTPEITSIQKIHEVTSADGKRGLWGILDKRLPEGFEGDKNRAIQALQNAMRAKLDAMSPADRASLGFPKGLPDGRVNLDFIKPGDKIDFGALLTPQEIQDALDGKLADTPRSAVSVAEQVAKGVNEVGGKVTSVVANDLSPAELETAMKGAEDEMIGQDRVKYGYTLDEQKALRLAEDQMIRDELAKDKMTATLSGQSYDDARNAFTAKEFAASQVVETKATALSAFEQAPAEVKTQMMLRTTGNIRQALFLTPELMADTRMNAPFDYTINRGAMGFVQMGRITEKFAEFHSGQFNRFNRMAFPLHPSQVDQVVRLVSLAQDPRFFGTAGLPKSVETVDQYTRRIAHLALSSGKEKELFMLLQGRRNSLI